MAFGTSYLTMYTVNLQLIHRIFCPWALWLWSTVRRLWSVMEVNRKWSLIPSLGAYNLYVKVAGGGGVKSEVTGRGPPKGIAQFEGKNPLFQDSPTVGEILYFGQNGCKIENKLCETTKNHSHRHFVCTFLVRGFLIPGKKLQFVTGANPGLKSDGSIIQ